MLKILVETDIIPQHADHLNILLVGSGDLRHVLTSLANASHHTSKPIHVSKLRYILVVFLRMCVSM